MSINKYKFFWSFFLFFVAAAMIFGLAPANIAKAQEPPTATEADEKVDDVESSGITELIAVADPARGKKKSMLCAACHTFDEGGRNMVGPNLWGVYGRDKASIEGFPYSKAMTEKGGKWDDESLNMLLTKPSEYIAGTKMIFPGLSNEEDRAALIAWLKTLQ